MPALTLQTLFYGNEISVPKPEGIVDVTIRHELTQNDESMQKRIGLVMQRLHGFNGSLAEGRLREKLENLLERETDKAWDLGYIPCNGLINTVYVPHKDRIYLVDLSDWVDLSKWSPKIVREWGKIREEVKKRRAANRCDLLSEPH